MRFLGLDHGLKRIGLAMSDENGRIAVPYKTVPAKDAASLIKIIAVKEKIGKIIIGLPKTFGAGESRQTVEVRKFATKLKKDLNLPIEFENEILTTKMAERSGVNREHLDSAAAAIILQSYLDKANR